MDPATWHPVTAWRRSDAAQAQVLLEWSPPAGLLATYTTPGQYLAVRTPDGESLFALCSAPGAPFQLLIRDAGGAAGWLTRITPGTPFHVSGAHGAGFETTDVGPEAEVLLVATGSGVAPVRPLAALWHARGVVPTLLYGARTPAWFAFLEELRAWHAQGRLHATFHVSDTDAPHGFAGGLVLDGLRAAVVNPARTVAYLCGVPGMVTDGTALLEDLGVPRSRVRVNY